jgi:NADPH:quinone reductase-like Zn-dependent oxidoreductase
VHLSYEEGAIWMQYITAYGALIYEGKLTAGDFVLVTAASSSVGIAAIEICKDPRSHQHCHHAHRKKKAELLALGADHVIVTDEEVLPERVKEITDGKVARIVFDPIGGKGLEALAAAAEPSGTIFLYGFYCDWTHAIPAPLFAALMKHLTVKAYSLFSRWLLIPCSFQNSSMRSNMSSIILSKATSDQLAVRPLLSVRS